LRLELAVGSAAEEAAPPGHALGVCLKDPWGSERATIRLNVRLRKPQVDGKVSHAKGPGNGDSFCDSDH
jgi:hypothetical protein